MRVLVACEYSGRVRDAFLRQGHYAMSVDLLESESNFGDHYKGDVRAVLSANWDLLVAHPPCTNLAVSGARHFARKRALGVIDRDLDFVRFLMNCDIPRIAIENPVSLISSAIRKPEQIIQPWMFGHGETKATCLWLKGLPKLTPTDIVDGRENKVHRMPPSADRWKNRSRTFLGIAEAMATQWGRVSQNESQVA